jgi:hypothetical protein
MIGFRNQKYERSEVLDQKYGEFRDQEFRVQRSGLKGEVVMRNAEKKEGER